MTRRRLVEIGGTTFELDKCPPVNKGGWPGNSSHPWYAVRIDSRLGRVIDASVPAGQFRTKRDLLKALRQMHGAKASHNALRAWSRGTAKRFRSQLGDDGSAAALMLRSKS